jgi:hypothetical protein
MKKYIDSIYSKYIQIYNNKYKYKLVHSSSRKINKVVVFDLDETIGSFGELMNIWNSLEKLKEINSWPIEFNQELFNRFLDLYPECLRHGILVIFEYLLYKKKSGECHKIFIYTNNKGSPNWPSKIRNYIDYKLNTVGLIDQIINAFKINNVIIEPMRTNIKKTYTDFIRCSILPKNTEICFIDNTYYSKMVQDKIYYIQPKSYNHKLLRSVIRSRLFESPFFFQIIQSNLSNKPASIDYINEFFLREYPNDYTHQNTIETPIDIIISQKIMYHIKEFFYLTTRHIKTKKIKTIYGSFTRKKHR